MMSAAPQFINNNTLRTDLNIPYINDVIKQEPRKLVNELQKS